MLNLVFIMILALCCCKQYSVSIIGKHEVKYCAANHKRIRSVWQLDV